MIKIQEHLNREDADAFLDGLALKLWSSLNKRLADDLDYQHYSLIKRLDRLIIKINEPNYKAQYANNDIDSFNRQRKFFEYLQRNNNDKLKALIISRPEELLILRNEILDILRQDDLFVIDGSTKQTTFGALLIDQLFVYDNFRKSSICPELVKDMNLQNAFCPYCNYVRVQVIDLEGVQNPEIINRAYLDIDHFHSKSKNPFFALSFFNLIPSCHNCNSTEKRDKDFELNTHSNPFHKSYNSSHKFEIDEDYIIKGNTESLMLNKITQSDDFMDQDLHLSERYAHTYIDAVNELIENYLNYQHYRSSPLFAYDYVDTVIQRVPRSGNDILKKEAGKMFLDVFRKIDVFDII